MTPPVKADVDDDEAESPLAMYLHHCDLGNESDGDADDLFAITKYGTEVTGIHTRNASRFLAASTEAVAEALAEPHSLLTADDANNVIAAACRQIIASGKALEQVSRWLGEAHLRGEVADPLGSACAVLHGAQAELTSLAARYAWAKAADVDGQRLPIADSYDELAALVSMALGTRGVTFTDLTVHGDLAQWTMRDGDVLQVDDRGWSLNLKPEDDSQSWKEAPVSLPNLPYAHPEQVASIVADYYESKS